MYYDTSSTTGAWDEKLLALILFPPTCKQATQKLSDKCRLHDTYNKEESIWRKVIILCHFYRGSYLLYFLHFHAQHNFYYNHENEKHHTEIQEPNPRWLAACMWALCIMFY